MFLVAKIKAHNGQEDRVQVVIMYVRLFFKEGKIQVQEGFGPWSCLFLVASPGVNHQIHKNLCPDLYSVDDCACSQGEWKD